MRRAHLMTALTAAAALAIAVPAAHASVGEPFDSAWNCAEAAVQGVEDLAGTGAKALKFIASPGGGACVTRLGTPVTLAPIAAVLGLANGGVLSHNCTAKLYDTAAKPLATVLSTSLGELGILPKAAEDFLAKIITGELGGEALSRIPGLGAVTGSLTCGCDMYDAGLSIETIERVLHTADNLGNACGGSVWVATKKVGKAVGKVATGAAKVVTTQISNLGDSIAGQEKHMSLQDYFDQNWVNGGKVELFASDEFAAPGRWHQGQSWKGTWDVCKLYFDKHTMSAKNAQDTCDDMRSGTTKENGLFADNGFQQRMFQRIFQFDVTAEVAKAREAARTQFANMQPEANVPQGLLDEVNANLGSQDKVNARLQAEHNNYVSWSVDEVYGVPNKEKEHNGEYVYPETPPTWWPANTVGARALTFYSEVRQGSGSTTDRADAAKAVQLAMQDLDVTMRVSDAVGKKILKVYADEASSIAMSRQFNRDLDQEKIDSLIAGCNTQTCRDTIASDWASCHAQAVGWFEANKDIILDSSGTRASQSAAAAQEDNSHRAACLAQANKTLHDSRNIVQGDTPMPGNALPQVTTGRDRYTPGTMSGGGRGNSRDDVTTGRNPPDTHTTRDPFGGSLRDRMPARIDNDSTADGDEDDGCSISQHDSRTRDGRAPREPLERRAPDRMIVTPDEDADSTANEDERGYSVRQRKITVDDNRVPREPLTQRATSSETLVQDADADTTSDERGGYAIRRDDSAAEATRVPRERLGRRLSNRMIVTDSEAQETTAEEDPAQTASPAIVGPRIGRAGLDRQGIAPVVSAVAATASDLPGCTAIRTPGMWMCEAGEAQERCEAAKERGEVRSCYRQDP